MMIRTELVVCCSLLTLCVSAATSFSRNAFGIRPSSMMTMSSSLHHAEPVFGIRGGGLFGNNNSNKSATSEEKYV